MAWEVVIPGEHCPAFVHIETAGDRWTVLGVGHGVRCVPTEQWGPVIATCIFFNACVEWLKAPQIFGRAFMMVDHDDAFRSRTEAIGAVAVVDAHGFRFVFRNDFVLAAVGADYKELWRGDTFDKTGGSFMRWLGK